MHDNLNISELYKRYINCNFSICTDTRNILKDSMFFALKGGNFDGNKYALMAIEQGCKYAVVDDISIQGDNILMVENVLKTLQALSKHHCSQLNIPIICIGGSNGKTTTKELIVSVLKQKYNTQFTKGNFNNHIGMPISLLSINNQHQIAAIEMGTNNPGEIDFLCKIAQPKYGLITNIGKEHLEGFGDLEGVAKEESYLYFHLLNNKGLAFVNADDNWLMRMSSKIENKFYYGNKGTDFDFSYQDNNQIEFKVGFNDETISGISKLWGKYNAENISAAISVGLYFKVPLKDIVLGIENYEPANNRSQIIKKDTNTIYLDAYNANPSSMMAALEAFNSQSNSSKWVLLGDMAEVGSHHIKEHLEILEWLLAHKLNAMVYGPSFFEAHELLENNSYINAFKTSDNFIRELNTIKISNSIILLKGSRTAAMEQFVDLL